MEYNKDIVFNNTVEYENIKFLIKNSNNRFQLVKNGHKLKEILEIQSNFLKKVS